MQELFTFTPYASGDGLNLSATVIDGQPWFIAADVCRSLGIKNPSHAMARLDDDEKALQKCRLCHRCLWNRTPSNLSEYTVLLQSGGWR